MPLKNLNDHKRFKSSCGPASERLAGYLLLIFPVLFCLISDQHAGVLTSDLLGELDPLGVSQRSALLVGIL